jgi:hypothetical protein
MHLFKFTSTLASDAFKVALRICIAAALLHDALSAELLCAAAVDKSSTAVGSLVCCMLHTPFLLHALVRITPPALLPHDSSACIQEPAIYRLHEAITHGGGFARLPVPAYRAQLCGKAVPLLLLQACTACNVLCC